MRLGQLFVFWLHQQFQSPLDVRAHCILLFCPLSQRLFELYLLNYVITKTEHSRLSLIDIELQTSFQKE